jgi:FMN phosphatase YigB (HAD superfamily)
MRYDFSFHRLQALRDHARTYGYPESLAEEVFEVFIGERSRVELYDEVLPALERLRRKYRLFSASNGNADLNRIGLAHMFERSVCAREVGAAKPRCCSWATIPSTTSKARAAQVCNRFGSTAPRHPGLPSTHRRRTRCAA